jgi:hypothetical protein
MTQLHELGDEHAERAQHVDAADDQSLGLVHSVLTATLAPAGGLCTEDAAASKGM